ncbi:hypothetical protein MKW98_013812 [Papaver atlanticum]|uniref:Uncharacterized protein n=1 Tax=Papaver atlanticum TaxID=357466 RepID=A0AAD4TAW2_9MAGN|nr:hypothetical protein MKW98_013812 [Papaver atlanticum]
MNPIPRAARRDDLMRIQPQFFVFGSCRRERKIRNGSQGHPKICENGVVPNRALDPTVLFRLKQFRTMTVESMSWLKIRQSMVENSIRKCYGR